MAIQPPHLMHRITRKTGLALNSAESHLFISSPYRLNITVKFLPGAVFLSRQTLSLLQKSKFNHHHSPSSSFPHRRPTSPYPTAMESEPVVAAIDDVTVGPNSLGAVSADEDISDRNSGSVQPNQDAMELDSKSSEPDAMAEDVGGTSSSTPAQGDEVLIDERGDNNENFEGEESEVNPEEVLLNVMRLSCESSAEGGECDVYLVGTAHVSTESCKEVQAVISFLKPQVVFLELCSGRVAVLSPQNLKVPTMGEMVNLWKKNHNMFGIIYSWFLAKVASRLDVFPGTEFRVGYEEAMKYGGKVVLGDRPVSITLKRTWAKMPLWHKTKLLYSLVFQSIFLPSPAELTKMLKEMDDGDMLTVVIQEMSKTYPTLMETLVHERDQYMSSRLLKVASEHSSVVAVVGKGHLQGIKKYWKQPVAVNELLEIPSKSPVMSAVKVVTTVGVAVAGVAIVSGIYLSCRK